LQKNYLNCKSSLLLHPATYKKRDKYHILENVNGMEELLVDFSSMVLVFQKGSLHSTLIQLAYK